MVTDNNLNYIKKSNCKTFASLAKRIIEKNFIGKKLKGKWIFQYIFNWFCRNTNQFIEFSKMYNNFSVSMGFPPLSLAIPLIFPRSRAVSFWIPESGEMLKIYLYASNIWCSQPWLTLYRKFFENSLDLKSNCHMSVKIYIKNLTY